MPHRTTRVYPLVVAVLCLFGAACSPEDVHRAAAQIGVTLTQDQAAAVSAHKSRSVEQKIRDRWPGTQHDDAAVRVARCESGLNPRAQNRTSSAYGLFQFLNGTWGSTGISKTSDADLQIEAAYVLWTQRGWQPWECRP